MIVVVKHGEVLTRRAKEQVVSELHTTAMHKVHGTGENKKEDGTKSGERKKNKLVMVMTMGTGETGCLQGEHS